VGGYRLVKERAARSGKEETVGATILVPYQYAALLHAVQELAHVSLGDQQPICQLLLGNTLGSAKLCEEIELCHTQAPAA
jgi:hypothetical protein